MCVLIWMQSGDYGGWKYAPNTHVWSFGNTGNLQLSRRLLRRTTSVNERLNCVAIEILDPPFLGSMGGGDRED